GFSTNGQQNSSSVVDLKTLKTTSRVKTDANPDALLYNPAEGAIYTFNGRGKSATVFSAKTGEVTATIPLGGKPDSGAADPAAAYDPANQTASVSAGASRTGTVAHEDSPDQWAVTQTLTTERGARTMTVDPKTHRIYLANAKNRQDPSSFKVLVYGTP